MKVSELIEELKKYPQDMPCVVNAWYQGGYDSIRPLEKIKIVLNKRTSYYNGEHSDFYPNDTDKSHVEALLFPWDYEKKQLRGFTPLFLFCKC